MTLVYLMLGGVFFGLTAWLVHMLHRLKDDAQ